MATMATRRMRSFVTGEGPMLPRSSSGGMPEKLRNERRGTLMTVLMVIALITTVYVVSRATSRLPRSDVVSTGEGEGVEEFLTTWGTDHHNTHPHQQEAAVAQKHSSDTHAHFEDAPLDSDGSVVVKSTSTPGAATPTAQPTHPVLAPAHAVGGGSEAHTDSTDRVAAAAAGSGHASGDDLPDPAEEAGQAVHQHPHPVHAAPVDSHAPATGLYALSAVDIDGKERKLSEFAGKVTLVVNVASQCGFTDANYKGLQEAYEKYHPHGFEVLAFPSNEFGQQEPGTEAEIKEFCHSRYHTTFPLFSKVKVNGRNAHPVYKFLKKELSVDQGGGGGHGEGMDIGWNFYKFLVGRDGKPVKLFHQDWHQAVIEHSVYGLLLDHHAHT